LTRHEISKAIIDFALLKVTDLMTHRLQCDDTDYDSINPNSLIRANKETIEGAFTHWAASGLLKILAADVEFIITGTSVLAGRYVGRDAFIRELVKPIAVRLSGPIVPTLERLIAEGDDVVALWTARSTGLDGLPYENTYCWVFTLADGLVSHVTVFFDSGRVAELWKRSEPYLNDEIPPREDRPH
jgi:ketosteroid isomerase-like protein